MLIIGFGHRARQGKSFCAAAIEAYARKKRLTARTYSFSDEVLAHCCERGLIPQGTRREALGPWQLEILARAGVEERLHDPDVWVDRLFARIEAEALQVALIPNLRFPNEAERVNSLGGIAVLVERLNVDGSPYIATERDPNHLTETSLRHWAWHFRLSAMSGQVLWLEAQARALLDYMIG